MDPTRQRSVAGAARPRRPGPLLPDLIWSSTLPSSSPPTQTPFRYSPTASLKRRDVGRAARFCRITRDTVVWETVGRPKAARIEENTERFLRRRQQEHEVREAQRERARAQREWNEDKSLANEAVLAAAIERLNRARERAEEC